MSLKINSILVIFCLFTASILSACEKSDSSQADNTQQIDDQNVEGWYFRIVYSYPMSMSYEPIVLFKDGQYLEIKDKPLEDIDKEQDKKQRPQAWGTWEKKGDTFYLTNSSGHVSDYKLGSGSWFPAFAYSEKNTLAKSYENITGGNYGGGTHALFKTSIEFPEKGYFYHSSNGAVITPNSTGWSDMKEAGTYTLNKHTLVLKYNDGKEARLSFAIGAKGTPAAPNMEMLFIGGDVFVTD